jgi:hypothetical protein
MRVSFSAMIPGTQGQGLTECTGTAIDYDETNELVTVIVSGYVLRTSYRWLRKDGVYFWNWSDLYKGLADGSGKL